MGEELETLVDLATRGDMPAIDSLLQRHLARLRACQKEH